MKKKRYLFIVNPISGGKVKTKLSSIIKKNLNSEKIYYEIIYTEYPHHAAKIVEEKMDDFDLIVAVGGDGTINEIAGKMEGKDKAMSIIPMGSGNGLARYLKISLSPTKAVQNLNDPQLVKLDTAKLNDHFFISIAGIGFDSLIASAFKNSKNRGFINYARLVIREYFRYKEQTYLVELDGKKEEKKALMIVFANSNQFGYNTRIAPNANISDSFLDVCIVRKPSYVELPYLLWQIWTGNADKSKHIEIIKANKIKVNQGKHVYANIDGEAVKVGHNIEIKVKNKNLSLLYSKV